MQKPEMREYKIKECVVFAKTKAEWGGFSNMCAGYPLIINGLYIHTSESLYQACRFPNNITILPYLPTIQELILREKNPMAAKFLSKKYTVFTRLDWIDDFVRIIAMRWVLKVKLACNWTKFSKLLLDSGTKPIVELSKKDDFWGAKITKFFANLLSFLKSFEKYKSRYIKQAIKKVLPAPIGKLKR